VTYSSRVPLYEYECMTCGVGWEELQRVSDTPTTSCPDCGANAAKRLVSKGSFVLKGGGWAQDGYSTKTGG
jgi:putative FmdB family regulatory protein